MYKCICSKEFKTKQSYLGHCRSCKTARKHRREIWLRLLPEEKLRNYFEVENLTASVIFRKYKCDFEKLKVPISPATIINSAKSYGIKTKSIKEACNNKSTRELCENTCITKYGVKNARQSDASKEKAKKTCLDKYGVENPSQNEDVKEKKRLTFQENYGVDHYFQTDEFIESHKAHNIKKYGKSSYLYSEQYFKDMQKNHGVDHVSKLPGVTAKQIATNIKKYGHPCPGALVQGYSKAATQYIEQYIADNNLNSKLCKYAESEIRFSSENITFNSSQTVAYDLTVYDQEGNVDLILEYHGLAYHATESDYINDPNRKLPAARLTVKEVYELQEKKKLWAVDNLLDGDTSKYIEVFK